MIIMKQGEDPSPYQSASWLQSKAHTVETTARR